MAAVETTVSFEELNTVTSITPAVFSLDIAPTTINGDDGLFTFSVNGQQVIATSTFLTTFIFSETTLDLSFSSRQVAFQLTGEGSTEVVIPGEHTHLTINGIETAVNIPGFTTTLVASGSSNVIIGVPATTTQMIIPEATYVFSAITDKVATFENGNTYYCGTNTETTYAAGDNDKTCVVGAAVTVTLPSDASALYLHGVGLTTSFALEGITTTFVPRVKAFTIFRSVKLLHLSQIFRWKAISRRFFAEIA